MLTIGGPVKITTHVRTLYDLRAFLALCDVAQLDQDAPLKAHTRLGGRLQALTVESNTVTPAHLKTDPEPRYSPVASRP